MLWMNYLDFFRVTVADSGNKLDAQHPEVFFDLCPNLIRNLILILIPNYPFLKSDDQPKWAASGDFAPHPILKRISHTEFVNLSALAKCWVGFEKLNSGDSRGGRNWKLQSNNCNDDADGPTNESSCWLHQAHVHSCSSTSQVFFRDGTLTTKFGKTWAMQEAPHLFLTTSTLVICSASCKTALSQNYRAKDAL